jgi:hypothetical protein
MKEITVEISCELDEIELLMRGQMLSQAYLDFEQVQLQKKAAMKEFADELEGIRSRINKLCGIIRSKAEPRMVNCAVQFHKPVQGTKRIVRLDTGEIVRDEPMSAQECQVHMFDEK